MKSNFSNFIRRRNKTEETREIAAQSIRNYKMPQQQPYGNNSQVKWRKALTTLAAAALLLRRRIQWG